METTKKLHRLVHLLEQAYKLSREILDDDLESLDPNQRQLFLVSKWALIAIGGFEKSFSQILENKTTGE